MATKVRESNIELLRIISMFMVLVLHANFLALERPSFTEITTAPIPSFIRYFIESLSIVAVNIFVMISGWFGIKFKVKGLCNLMFQIVFIWGGYYFVSLILGLNHLSIKGLLECIAFTNWDQFIKSYICLYILSPVLNAYCENSDVITQRRVLILFFLFSSTYGLFGGASFFFDFGYGTLSFIGLYLLARYIRMTKDGKIECKSLEQKLFPSSSKINFFYYIVLSLITTLFVTGCSVLFSDEAKASSYIYAYNSPLVILAATYLLLGFVNIKLKPNKVVNWVAVSCFAVYLVHSQVDIRDLFIDHIRLLADSTKGFLTYFYIALYLLFVYILSILVDQIRRFAWEKVNFPFVN